MDDGFVQTVHGLRGREVFGTPLRCFKQEVIGHRVAHSQSLMKKDLRGHFGCVNAIEFSSNGKFIASGGDDRRLLLWDVGHSMFDDKTPDVIETMHISNINSCSFDCHDGKIATGGNDGQVIIHDFHAHQSTAVYGLSDAVYCLSADPQNSTILASANDEGKAQIIDTRLSADTIPFVLADLDSAMHSIMYNPVDPRLLVTANSKHGIGLWDIRMPLNSDKDDRIVCRLGHCEDKAAMCVDDEINSSCLNYKSTIQNCMSVRFNSLGDKIMALRRRSGPVLYDVGKPNPIYEFDYSTYYNACTLKSCSFAGLRDEYVMSGSDDFCIYLWKVPTDPAEEYIQCQPHMILKGHRSIVNQVRYCPQNQVIISSGVEKLIKLWSPYSIPGCTGHLVHSRRYGDDDEIERDAYSHEEYIHMVLQAGSFLSHDYTNGTIDEEPCMIAFFDSLIQREIEQTVDDKDDEITGDDEDGSNKSDEENGNASDKDNDDGGGGDDDGGGGGGERGVPGVGGVHMSSSDAPLCGLDSSTSAANVSISAPADSENEDSNIQGTAESESRSRAFYLGLDSSSSDSDSEVDEILSAMYSRYMSSREQAINSSSRPASKKISSVIARGKQRENRAVLSRKVPGTSQSTNKKKVCPVRLQRIREDLQHSEDQFLRDNATSMSVLADVIDSFVDNLVPDGSGNSRTLSDTNDGHMSSDSNVLAEDSRLIGVSTSEFMSPPPGQRRRSSVSSTSNSRSFPFAGRSFTSTVSPSAGTSSNTFNFGSSSEGRHATGVFASSSSLGSHLNHDSPNKDFQAFHNNLSSHTSSSSAVPLEATTISSDNQCTQTNGNDGVNGKGKKRSAETVQNKPDTKGIYKKSTSLTGKGLRDIPAQSTVSNQPFHSEAARNPTTQSSHGSSCLNLALAVGAATDTQVGKKDGLQAKFVAPEKKSINTLQKKPSLLSLTSQVSSSSSSSSLSSDPSVVSDSSIYFASSSSHETDSSKENQEENNKPRVIGLCSENSSGNIIVQFKKAKTKGRHFRPRKIDSDSSSEEDR